MATPLDRSAPPRPGEELDIGSLRALLERELPELRGELVVEQFPSGFSNLTYLLRVGDRELVLRRPPFGSRVRSAHDMGREHRILSALSPVYPKAPRPWLYCEDETVLGAPFYLMERIRGVILRPGLQAREGPDAGQMAQIAGAFVDTLCELHEVDYQAAGLGDLGRPEGYARRQVEGWRGRYERARTDDLAELERVGAWLGERIPVSSVAALIHNDFKYDNLVLDADDPSRVRAVLDWEMATLGDPWMDLGTSLGYWIDADDPPGLLGMELSPTTLPGNPGRAEIAHRYAERRGDAPGDVVFYYAYGLFKIAVIVQQIYFRYVQGHTQDPRFARLTEVVGGCGKLAWQAIQKGRIDRLFA